MVEPVNITYNNLVMGDGTNFGITNLNVGNLPIRQASELAATRDGGFIFNQNVGFRTISFNIELYSNTPEQLFIDIRNLKNAITTTNIAKNLKINYWDGSERNIDCFPAIIPNPVHEGSRPDSASFTCVVTAPYPYFSGPSSELITETLLLSQSEGLDLPATLPATFVAGSATNSYTFDNNGDTFALLAIEFTNGINPTLTNSSQGSFVQIEKNITGETVTLEYSNNGRIIEDNNGTSFEQYFIGETSFLFVPTGTNIFTFSASTFDASASCKIQLTKFYNG